VPTDRQPEVDIADYIVDIPEEVVMAIGLAAVEAYKEAERQERLKRQREYSRARREVDRKRQAMIADDIRAGIHIKRARRVRGADGVLRFPDQVAQP
jgi:hypothetical protein